VLAGVVAVAYAIEAVQDFANPAVPLRLAIFSEFIMCSMAFAALAICATAAIRMAWRERRKGRLDVAHRYWHRFFLPRICVFPAGYAALDAPHLAR
jgi:hypothetical protein